jgi:AcrR family transcriptional regulator
VPNSNRQPDRRPPRGRKAASTESSLMNGRRRDQLFLEAALLFQERGYDATSMQDIADAVGILKGSLYHYIGTKEDLLYEIVREQQSSVIAIADEIAVLDLTPLEKIKEFMRRQIEHNVTHLTTTSVYQHDFQSLRGERRERIIKERDRYEQFVREQLAEGQRQGLIRADLDPKLAGIAMLSTMNYIYLWYRPSGPKSSAEIAEAFIDLVLHGIEAPTAPSDGKRRARR